MIHYDAEPGTIATKRSASIVEELVDLVRDGVAPEVVESPADPEKVIDRARSRLGEREYDLTSNNCEHFAKWCTTGVISCSVAYYNGKLFYSVCA